MRPPASRGGARSRDARDAAEEDRLDWKRSGFSPRTRAVAFAVAEALLSDEDDDCNVVPGSPETCARAVDALDRAAGRSSPDLRRGFLVLALLMQWLPLVVIGVASRATRLSIEDRVRYLSALEASRFGLFSMLLVAFKVPLCIPAFEEAAEFATIGIDRPDPAARRRLPIATAERAPEPVERAVDAPVEAPRSTPRAPTAREEARP